jgi:hypothetical protein
MMFFQWEEFRAIRSDLERQPRFLREKIMDYEEELTFKLLEDGFLEKWFNIVREGDVAK